MGYSRKLSGLIFLNTEHQATSTDVTELEQKNLLSAHSSAKTCISRVFSDQDILLCKLYIFFSDLDLISLYFLILLNVYINQT